MTIDARTASPEPSLHAATLLSRTRLTQVEVAARLGISERMLRYHVAGRPMPYTLRLAFEALVRECEMLAFAQALVGKPLRNYQRELVERIAEMPRGRLSVGYRATGDEGKCSTCGEYIQFDIMTGSTCKCAKATPLLVDHDPTARLTGEESEALRRAFTTPPTWMGIDHGASGDVYEPRMVRCPNPACNEAYSPILDACPACAHPNARPTRYRK